MRPPLFGAARAIGSTPRSCPVKTFLYGLACLAVAIIAAIWIMDSWGGSRDTAGDLTVRHSQTSNVRRVAISADARVSRNQDPVYVQLVEGTIPAGVTRLTVLTDENCAPDADGVVPLHQPGPVRDRAGGHAGRPSASPPDERRILPRTGRSRSAGCLIRHVAARS